MLDRPNILCVVLDCARSDYWLGDRGPSLTPHLDRIRRAGVTLPTTIVEQSATSPNFATLLTGHFSLRHGVRMILGQSLRAGVSLLTEELAGLGYHTYAEVTGPLIADIGLGRGFERYEYRAPCDYLHTAWGDRFVARLKEGAYRSPWFILLHLWEMHIPRQVVPPPHGRTGGEDRYKAATTSLDAQLGRVFEAAGDEAFLIVTGDHGDKIKGETFPPGTAVDYIRDYLKADKARGPNLFHLSSAVGPTTLHHLFVEFIGPALGEAGRLKRRPAPSFAWFWRAGDLARLVRLAPRITPLDLLVLKAPLKLTEWLHVNGILDGRRSRAKVRRALGGVRPESLDGMFARLMISSYKRNYEEGHSLHVYDTQVNVPLVLRWPGRLPAGATVPRMVRQADILPTVLDLLGAWDNGRSDRDGRSFKPLLEGRAWEPEPAFLSTGGYLAHLEINGVRTENWKYTFGPQNPELPEELYDLRRDPGETVNLASARPDERARLKTLAEKLIRSQAVPPAPDAVRNDWKDAEDRLRSLGYIE